MDSLKILVVTLSLGMFACDMLYGQEISTDEEQTTQTAAGKSTLDKQTSGTPVATPQKVVEKDTVVEKVAASPRRKK